jgi:hypothetical protein
MSQEPLCLPLNTTIDISNNASSNYEFIVNGTSYNTKTYTFKLDVGTYKFNKHSQHPISFIGLPDGVTITDNNGADNNIALTANFSLKVEKPFSGSFDICCTIHSDMSVSNLFIYDETCNNSYKFEQKYLGNGIKGHQAKQFGHMDSGGERSANRRYLAKSFGNLYNTGLGSSPALYNKNVLGPFRTAFSAGDIVTKNIENTNPKYGRESSQVNGNNLSRIKGQADGTYQNGNAMYSGNSKFVYEGSDYTRYKKLAAINKTYNDTSHGGNGSTGKGSFGWQQHAIRAVRR